MDDTISFDRNDYRADRFQIARDCSVVSIGNNRKNIRLSGTRDLQSALKVLYSLPINNFNIINIHEFLSKHFIIVNFLNFIIILKPSLVFYSLVDFGQC